MELTFTGKYPLVTFPVIVTLVPADNLLQVFWTFASLFKHKYGSLDEYLATHAVVPYNV